MKVLYRKKLTFFSLYIICALIFALQCHDASASSYALTLTSSGSQSIDVTANTGTAISSDAINVTTTCRYGYNFTIQTSVDNNTLYLNGDPGSYAYTYFSSATGFDPLNETENEWGYFYDGNTVPTNTSIFSPVPSSLEEPATIKTPLDTPASSDINDSFNIYYGVSASANAEKGTYKMVPDEHDNDGTIVYVATAADTCSKYTVHFDPTSIFEGNTLTGTGTMNDQLILENVATPLTDNSFTAPNGYYFAGWNTAQDGSGTQYTNQQQVTDLTTAGNTITLYAIWTNCPANTICYSANVSNPSDVVGEMGNQTISSSDTSVTLYAPNYSRANHGFAAWNTKADGTGANYGPNQTIEFAAGTYNTTGLKLHAKWIESAGSLQNWTGCSSMNIGDVTALKDARDNNVYAVAKLVDNKCWMIENLRLANKDSNNNNINLSSTNTHNPSLPLTNSNGTSTSNRLSAPINPYVTEWCSYYATSCIDKSMLATNNTANFINNTNSTQDSDIYSYGNYYNWYSATAGRGNYNKTSGSVTGDLCPTGWRLPINVSTNSDFSILDEAMGGSGNHRIEPGASNTWRSYPNNYIYSGYLTSSSINNRNISGFYWSSSAYEYQYAYGLSLGSGFVSPDPIYSYFSKSSGRPIRCIKST